MRLVQLVEHQIVVLVVVGSSPTSHPPKKAFIAKAFFRSGASTSYQGLRPQCTLRPFRLSVFSRYARKYTARPGACWRLRFAPCGCDVGLEPFADVPARPLMRPSLRSMRFDSTVSPSMVETWPFLPSFPRIWLLWCLLHPKSASRHKKGHPSVCSGQGLFLGGRPCPVFSIPGHSCGQGPSPRIRPCPLQS